MIIKNDQPARAFGVSRLLWILPVVALSAAMLLWLLFNGRGGGKEASPLLYCDAEQIDNGQFVNGGFRFANGQTQSRDYARSGRHASKIPPGQGARYGLSYDWRDFQPGARYEVSIWRRQFGSSVGQLVVSGDGPAAFYKATSTAAAPEPDDWEQLRLQFTLPPGDGLDKINIHVYTDGPDSVYFDDLKLQLISAADFEAFTPRKLYLEVNSDGMQQLSRKRQAALEKGVLETAPGDWVQARFREGDQDPIPVRIRLKGDWLDHLRGDKWSFRIKCRGGGSWNRLVTFSLHTPAARYFLHEWLLHQLWEKEGVLTSRYDFAELFLNGESLGIYAYEEHFEKQLVEYRERREGPILKFSEAGFWAGIARQLKHHGFVRPNSGHTSMNWENAPIEAFNENDLPDNPALQSQFLVASQRLEAFRRGEYLASDLFDIELLARYFALSDLLQAYHGISWHNQRLYYNPLTDRLEPIGFDGFGEQPEVKYTFLGEGALHPEGPLSETFFSYVFQDTAFAARYIQLLDRYTNPAYLQNFLDSLSGEWNQRLVYLQQEFPDYRPLPDQLTEHAAYVRSLLSPFDHYSLQATAGGSKGKPSSVILHNKHLLPLEVVGIGASEDGPAEWLEKPLLLPAQTPRRLLSRVRTTDGRINNWSEVKYIGEESRILQGTPRKDTLTAFPNARFVFFRVLGLETRFHTRIFRALTDETTPALPLFAGNEGPPLHSSFKIKGQNIYFHPGTHRIDTTLFFPAGYQVYIPAGTSLNFIRSGRFLSRSPIRAEGSAEKPIRFFSSDGQGQGLLLFEVEARSTFVYTNFESLQAPRQDAWQLTGAVTAYRSNVRFQRCSFRQMPSEDALNLIRSNFLVDECTFADNASDALDSDFSKGEVRGTSFQRMVNDGLDLSGSIVTVSDCRFSACGDKGISIGEESDMTASDIQIEQSPIAVASKDLSTALLRNVTLLNCRQGFVAFQKKPEFGPGYLFVESFTADEVDRLYNIAPGSSLQLGDRLIN